MSVMVSVIIPVYNTEKYITECLDSLVKQSLKNIEIICINDMSTDNTLSILLDYENKYDMVKVIQLEANQGQANARNIGVKNALGKYIYFMDSDDMLKDTKALEQMYSIMEGTDVECLLFDSQLFYEDEKFKALYGEKTILEYDVEEGVYTGETFFEGMVNSRMFSVAVWLQFWRKDYLIEKQLEFRVNTSLAEDLLFTFEAIYGATKIKYVKKCFHSYRIRENSSTTMKFGKRRFQAYCNCYRYALQFIEQMSIHVENVECLNQYLLIIKSYIFEYLEEMIANGEDLFGNLEGKDLLFMQQILLYRYRLVNRLFTKSEYQRIKQAEKVVIYGAGKVGKTVVTMLHDIGIYEFDVAVTNKKDDKKFGRKEVCEISEYDFTSKNVLVIVAVTEKYQNEMKHKLIKLGCDNYICI